jgi:peroxin-3
MSLQSESGIHASQMGVPSAMTVGDGQQDGGQHAQKAKKSKLQLWNDLKISCERYPTAQGDLNLADPIV